MIHCFSASNIFCYLSFEESSFLSSLPFHLCDWHSYLCAVEKHFCADGTGRLVGSARIRSLCPKAWSLWSASMVAEPGGKSGRCTDVRFGKPDAALIVWPSGVIYQWFCAWQQMVWRKTGIRLRFGKNLSEILIFVSFWYYQLMSSWILCESTCGWILSFQSEVGFLAQWLTAQL